MGEDGCSIRLFLHKKPEHLGHTTPGTLLLERRVEFFLQGSLGRVDFLQVRTKWFLLVGERPDT
jgi:hypothetical protein